jgi:hypothetical protein
MSGAAANSRFSAASYVVRGCVIGLSCLGIVWAAYVAPVFLSQAKVDTTSKRIIAWEAFKAEALLTIKEPYEDKAELKNARPSLLAGLAVINLRLIELMIARGDQEKIDRLTSEANDLIRLCLASSPAEPFLWTVLFWIENTRNGFNRNSLEYLKRSYLLGPNEGWIASKRNRFAMAIYPTLPPDLAVSAVSEFSRLVDTGFIEVAADILQGPGWPVREVLISSLKGADDANKKIFAKMIYRRGMDIEVPGVERAEWRPWH